MEISLTPSIGAPQLNRGAVKIYQLRYHQRKLVLPNGVLVGSQSKQTPADLVNQRKSPYRTRLTTADKKWALKLCRGAASQHVPRNQQKDYQHCGWFKCLIVNDRTLKRAAKLERVTSLVKRSVGSPEKGRRLGCRPFGVPDSENGNRDI